MENLVILLAGLWVFCTGICFVAGLGVICGWWTIEELTESQY